LRGERKREKGRGTYEIEEIRNKRGEKEDEGNY